MCELFSMSSRTPTTVNLSLGEFSLHGGQTDNHKDGWGIGYYHENDALVLREDEPAANSAQLEFVRSHRFASTRVMAHIRRATFGDVALRNTQPFARELGGRLHLFAHNGTLPRVFSSEALAGQFNPIGETDSEYAFCRLLDRMAVIWSDPLSPPPLQSRLDVFREFADAMTALGPSNFLYSDSEIIIAHSDHRENDDGVHLPGLYMLTSSVTEKPDAETMPGVKFSADVEEQDFVLVASVPLSKAPWQPLAQGEILVLRQGALAVT